MSKQILKRRIRAAGQIKKVTKAMSNVAGRKLTLTVPTLDSTNEYYDHLVELITSLPSSVQDHRYIKSEEPKNKLAIIISTDKGLVGALNRELATFTKNNLASVTHAILIGERALRFGTQKKLNIIHAFSAIGDYPDPEVIAPIADLALSFFEQNLVDGICVIGTEFESSIKHHPQIIDILPFDKSLFPNSAGEHFSFDISPTQMLEALVRDYLVAAIFRGVVSAKASEHSARVISMQMASDNADEMKENLLKVSFKDNQRAVTAEIADTTNARFALNSN